MLSVLWITLLPMRASTLEGASLGCLIKQAGIIIRTVINLWETPGIEPVTSGLTSVLQTSSSTN